MDTDDQEEVFEEDEMKNVNELASSKRLDCVDHNGKLKAITRERDHHQNKQSCDVCGKTFDNRMALGGHMRIHFQFKKVAGPNIKNKTEHFSSMRAHSDGEWKGIHRRSCSSTMSDSVSDDNNGYSELSCAKSNTECLKNVFLNWSQTGKRGRKSTGAVEGAENLMFMSRQSVIDIKDKRFDASEAEKQSLNEQLEVGRGGSLSVRLGNKSTDEIHREEHYEQKTKKKKAAAKIWMEMLSSDSEETDEEVGLIHDKNDGKRAEISFPTDQALGGHRSIHKNRQLELTIISVIEPYGASSPGAASQTSPTKMNFDLNQLNYDMEDEGIIRLYNV
jgi:hypothetical protein